MIQSIIKLTRGVPAVESFPNQQYVECTAMAIAEFGNEIQQYCPSFGFKPLRELIASERQTSPDQILIGQGSLQLLDLATRLLVKPGDYVFAEAPTYDRTITVLKRAGANIVTFKLEEDGLNPGEVEDYLKRGVIPKFIYLVTDFQNPSGTVMSEVKRKKIAELADKYNFLIFEDAPYRQLRYHGAEVPSIYRMNPKQVCLMSSYSKTICPGIRVGYMVVPAEFYKDLAKMAEDTYINASYINQATVFEYVKAGWFESHLKEINAFYTQRLDSVLENLEKHFSGRATWCKPEGGFFVGLNLKGQHQFLRMQSLAREVGLELTDGRGFFCDGSGDNFIRIPFCGLSPQEITEGIARLDQVVSNS